mgnify:CR=1 FL=1
MPVDSPERISIREVRGTVTEREYGVRFIGRVPWTPITFYTITSDEGRSHGGVMDGLMHEPDIGDYVEMHLVRGKVEGTRKATTTLYKDDEPTVVSEDVTVWEPIKSIYRMPQPTEAGS